jgi:hypothetical protein
LSWPKFQVHYIQGTRMRSLFENRNAKSFTTAAWNGIIGLIAVSSS